MQQSEAPTSAFSIVSAVHNVSAYLDEFFASLAAQTIGMGRLDVVLVDDGSTDDSLAKCQAFAAAWPESVRVLSQQNRGQAHARNAGIEVARGTWLAFTDPDDTLDSSYFEEVDRFLSSDLGRDVRLVSTRIVIHVEGSRAQAAPHPLDRKFADGNASYDLTIDSDRIQMSAATALFDRNVVRDSALRFDPSIRPTFEDGAFVARYLFAVPSPIVGAVATARYHYRKRAGSTLGRSGSDPDRYSVVPRLGHLATLQAAHELFGRVPVWVQNMVVYDLAWYLTADSAVQASTGNLPQPVLAEFHGLVHEIMNLIEPETVELFSIMPISDDIRFALRFGYRDGAHVPSAVTFADADPAARLVKITYRFTGPRPREQFSVDGRLVRPAHAKVRSIEFYQRVIARESISWVAAGSRVRVSLDGRNRAVSRLTEPVGDVITELGELGWRDPVVPELRPKALQHPEQGLARRARRRIGIIAKHLSKPALFELALGLALHSGPVRRRYVGAWVFMDRDIDAGDSGEVLYRFVAREHPEVRPWFVLNRDSADWPRLRRAGFRLVPYGSWRWQLLMLSAAHVASSHVDLYITRPLNRRRFGRPQWRYTFLAHGVIKDDLSRWLNFRHIDLFITSSEREYHSIVDDDTPYAFTTKEVKLTGLARFDALIARSEATPESDRNLVLVMPTWRFNLVGEAGANATGRAKREGFAQSEYARQFQALLASERLHALASARGLQLVFMPHPNMRQYLSDLSIPDGVRVAAYDEADVTEMVARGRVLITDYSSIAFNAAMIGLPTVYFQFDRAEFYSGAHPGRRGYFDYQEDGFGPVCDTVEQVVTASEFLLEGATGTADYSERMRHAFAFHDTDNARRIFEAMSRLNEPAMAEGNDAHG